jgi:hypothetical protein
LEGEEGGQLLLEEVIGDEDISRTVFLAEVAPFNSALFVTVMVLLVLIGLPELGEFDCI